ncbi:MAG: galactose mutarotase [Lachnoclostridium sp.]|nr:galactose mutarotase [Lachnoclostridium sp.]
MIIREFGFDKKGEAAKLYIFKNLNGMEMHVSDFGATLQKLIVPDKEGISRDVVLGYDDPSGYEGVSGTFFGATVGRNANRIGDASFVYNGKTYHLDKNNGSNNLHSGFDCWSFRVWNVKETTDHSITFSLESPDGDQGFPGAVSVEVTYSLTDDNQIMIEYYAKPEEDTPINMTNHSYFNLNGHESGTVRTQRMWIDSDAYTRTRPDLIPTGEVVRVEGTPMDFRTRKEIGRDIDQNYEALILGNGYDHNWVLNNDGNYQLVAELSSLETGITMQVYTDLPGVQVYSANFINHEEGKDGVIYEKNQGVCFETQYFPDALNHENFRSSICKKGDIYRTKTAYKFVV